MGKLIIKNRYATVPTSLLNNAEISLKAKGIYGYLQSKPQDWNFSIQRMEKQLKEGKDSIRKALHELEKHGYLERIPTIDESGRFKGNDYVLHESPKVAEKPSSENPSTEKPSSDSTDSISNIDISNIDISNIDISNKEKENIKEKRFNFRKELIEKGFDKELIDDWMIVRKEKKASNTKTALKHFLNEIEKVKGKYDKNEILKLCVINSWKGFKYNWLLNLEKKEKNVAAKKEKNGIEIFDPEKALHELENIFK